MKLRPIGTIFSQEYPPSAGSTNPRSRVTTYKVVAHIDVIPCVDHPHNRGEELMPIKIEYSDGEVIE